jgi:hypothetical protein
MHKVHEHPTAAQEGQREGAQAKAEKNVPSVFLPSSDLCARPAPGSPRTGSGGGLSVLGVETVLERHFSQV